MPLCDRCVLCGRIASTLDRDHRLVAVDLEIELLDHAAQVGQVLLAGDALLVVVLDRHAGNCKPLGGAEKTGIARPPGQRVADLVRVELNIVQAGAFEAGRQFQADRAGPDDRDIVDMWLGHCSNPYGTAYLLRVGFRRARRKPTRRIAFTYCTGDFSRRPIACEAILRRLRGYAILSLAPSTYSSPATAFMHLDCASNVCASVDWRTL